jgi:SAM-dependent methyltransferase
VPLVNEGHRKLCASPEWASHLQSTVLPAAASGLALGEEMLELGPGPGAATEWLRTRAKRLVVVERDRESADALARRFQATNVEVVCGDATALDFASCSFDSVAAFTMLHHVPTRPLQSRLLSEALRVLRPGGVLFGADGLHSDELHHFHRGDTYNPIEPAALLTLLGALGYGHTTITVEAVLTFAAHKPGGA